MIEMINVIERFRSSRYIVRRDLLYNGNQLDLLKFEKQKIKNNSVWIRAVRGGLVFVRELKQFYIMVKENVYKKKLIVYFIILIN